MVTQTKSWCDLTDKPSQLFAGKKPSLSKVNEWKKAVISNNLSICAL